MGIRLEDELYPPPPGGPLVQASKWDIEPITSTPSSLQFSSVLTNKTVMTLVEDGSVSVNGIMESTTGGFKFPDGTIQTSAGPTLAAGCTPDPVTGLPQQWPEYCHYDALELGAGDRLALGGRSDAAPITWCAYPGNVAPNYASRYRYNTYGAAKIEFHGWTNTMLFQLSDPNQPKIYSTEVNWIDLMVFKDYGGGSVGIGTGTPGSKLDVDGLIRGKAQSAGGIALRALNEFGTRVVDIGNHSQNHGIVRIFQSNGSTETVRLSGKPNAAMWLNSGGNVGIGTSSPNYKLDVCGTIRSKKVKVETFGCDFVYDPDYNRPTPEEKEKLYETQHHLRGVDSAAEIEKNGFDLGKNASGMIMNIEENGLDIIDLSKENKELRNQVAELEEEKEKLQLQYQNLEKRITALEKQIN